MAGITFPRFPGIRRSSRDRRRGKGRPGAVAAPASALASGGTPGTAPLLRQLPPRRLLRLPGRTAGDRDLVRRRLRRLPGCPRDGPRTGAGGAARPGRRPALLMCAGVTTFNALRNSGRLAGRPRRRPWPRRARPPGRAVRGADGVPHPAAIARGKDKEPLARQPGAVHYIDKPGRPTPPPSWRKLGGARVVLATVTVPEAMTSALGAIKPRGQLVVVGASPEPMQVPPFALIPGSTAVQGHASGTSPELSRRHLALLGADRRPPDDRDGAVAEAQAAYDKMMSGAARFRMVLTMDDSGSIDSHLRLARFGQDDARQALARSAGRAPLPRRMEARSWHRLLRRTGARTTGGSTLAARPGTAHAGPKRDLGERLLGARGTGRLRLVRELLAWRWNCSTWTRRSTSSGGGLRFATTKPCLARCLSSEKIFRGGHTSSKPPTRRSSLFSMKPPRRRKTDAAPPAGRHRAVRSAIPP